MTETSLGKNIKGNSNGYLLFYEIAPSSKKAINQMAAETVAAGSVPLPDPSERPQLQPAQKVITPVLPNIQAEQGMGGLLILFD